MPSIADLFITVSSDVTGAMSGLTAVDQKLNGTTTSMASATAAALPLAAAAGAVGAGFLSAIDEAASFEQQISGIKAVLSPTEAEAYGAAIEDLALKLGRDTVFGASQAANAIEELVKAGVPIEAVLNGGAEAATSLAAATGFDLARSAEFAGIAMATFHLEASEMEGVVDHLAGTVNASAADMNGLQFAFSAVGPVASTLGLTFQDTATALGIFANNGLRGSDAGTSLKTMLLNLQPTTENQVAAFTELGLYTLDTERAMAILTDRLSSTAAGQNVLAKAYADGSVTLGELFKAAKALDPALVDNAKNITEFGRATGVSSNAFFDAAGNAKSMEEIFELLKVGTAEMTTEQKLLALEMAFGADAVRAAAIAANEGAEGFNELAENIGKISAEDAAQTRLDNLKGSLEQMNGSFEAAQITIGQLFLPVIRQLVDIITGVVNGFLSLDPSIQTAIVAVVGITGVVAGLTAAFVLLAPVFAAVGAGFAIIVAAASPVLVPILAIVAAIAALKLAWETDFAGIQGVTAEVWTAIQPMFENIRNLFDRVMEVLTPFAQAFQGELPNAMQAFSNAMAPLLAQLPNFIRLIGDFWNAVSAIIQLLTAGDFSGAWDAFVGSVTVAGQNIYNALGNIQQFVHDTLGQGLVQVVANLPDAWGTFVQGAWEIGTRIAEAFANVMTFIGDQLGAGIQNIVAGLPDPWAEFINGAWNIGTRIAEAFGNFMTFIAQSLASIPSLVEGVGDPWESFINGAWNIGTRIGEAFTNFLNFIGQQIASIPDMILGIGDIFAPLINESWDIGTRISEAFENFIEFISQSLAIRVPLMVLQTAAGIFQPLIDEAWNLGGPISDAIMNVVGFIGGAIQGIPTFLEGLGDIFGVIVQAAQGLHDRIAAAIEPIKNLLANTFGSFWQWLTGAVTVPEAPAGGGGAPGGGPMPAPTGPLVNVGTLIISSQAEADAFLQAVADAVLASARRVTPPVSGATAL